MWLLVVSAVVLINSSLGFHARLSGTSGRSGGRNNADLIQTNVPYSESTANRRLSLNNPERFNIDSEMNREFINGNYNKQITIGSRAGQSFSRNSNRDGGRLPNAAFGRGNRFEGTLFGNKKGRSNLDDGRVPNSGINYKSNNGNFDKQRTIGSRSGSERFGANFDKQITTDFNGRKGSTQSRRSNLDDGVSNGVSRMGSRFDRNTLRSFPNVGDGRRESRGRLITVELRPRANQNNAYTRF